MTLPASGNTLSLNQIHVEVGGTSGSTVSLNETDVRGLISKGLNASNSISDYFGASSIPPFTADNTTTVGNNTTSPTANYYFPYPNSGTAYPFFNPDGSINVGGQANVYYATNDDANVDVRYRHISNMGGQSTYATLGRSPSGYRLGTPAKVQDASGHEHHNIAILNDGGDGYGPPAVFFYWEAQSGGPFSGSNWGSGSVYNFYTDLQKATNGYTGPADPTNYVGLMADDRTGANLLAANGKPFTYGDIAMLSQWSSTLQTPIINGYSVVAAPGVTPWVGGEVHFKTSFN